MKRRWLLTLPCAAVVAIGFVALPSGDGNSGPLVPNLIDEAVSAGVDHVYGGEFEHFVGGGVATFDCNDDEKPELFFAGGANPAALYVNRSPIGGALRFEDKPSPATDLTAVTGAYPIDIDSDNVTDLVVLRRKGNAVLRGLGDCTFEDATASLGLSPGTAWTTAFAATWETDQSLPTLALGNYLVPDTYDCDKSALWRPDGDRYAESVDLQGHCTLSLLFSDWNRDGNVDLRVSNDRNYDRYAREQLWRIRPGEEPREYTEADGWRDLVIWGMGIASHDLTGDGKPEVYLTSQADNKLQTLDDGATGPAYSDIALERGVIAQRPYVGDDILPSTAWHPEFDDVNNDGLIDLFVAKGNVDAQIDYAKSDPNNLLLGRGDGTFVERGEEAGIANDARSRGAAVVDLNLDGMLDLVVVNRRVAGEVRRNVGTGTATAPQQLGNWVAVRPRQPAPNVNAIGAWVEVRVGAKVTSHEVTVGGGHVSGDLGWVHFGLGKANSAEVRVTFPGAQPGEWQRVEANGFYEVSRGDAAPVRRVMAD
ncbi:MAG: CRTAC1 family protein [Actinomycetota bacterium]